MARANRQTPAPKIPQIARTSDSTKKTSQTENPKATCPSSVTAEVRHVSRTDPTFPGQQVTKTEEEKSIIDVNGYVDSDALCAQLCKTREEISTLFKMIDEIIESED